MSRIREIADRRDAIRSAVMELEHKDTPTEDDIDLQDQLLAEDATLATEYEPLKLEDDKRAAVRAERMEAVIAAAGKPTNLERTVGLTTFGRNNRNPFAELDLVRDKMVRRSELKSRALDAVERSESLGQFGQGGHDRAETATLRIQDDTPRFNEIADHILLTGSDEYQNAFRAYVQDPEGNASRAALSLTSANGGFLLPYVLDPTIVLTNTSSANPYRRIAAAKTTTSNAWQGVNSAGVSAGWLAEGAASSDASPTVGQIQITPKKAAAWVFGSYEVLADTDFAQQLPTLLSDAKDRLEETAFTTGNGTTQPKGIITAGTNTVNTATTLVYAIADVYKNQATLAPRFRNSNSAGWVMNVSYINKTRQFDTAGGASFWTNLGKGQPETLLGTPIYESTTMFGGTQAVGSKIAVFGDWSQFYIVDRVGVSLIYEPLVKDQATLFPTGQGGWFMFWRVGSDVSTNQAFTVLTGL